MRRTTFGGSGTGHGQIAQAELHVFFFLQRSYAGFQFIITDKTKTRRGGGKVSVL